MPDRHYIETQIIPALEGRLNDFEVCRVIAQLKNYVKKDKKKVQFQHACIIPSLTNNYDNENINSIVHDYLNNFDC
jgi:hypothetical protein